MVYQREKMVDRVIFPITRQTLVLYHCRSYFLHPQCFNQYLCNSHYIHVKDWSKDTFTAHSLLLPTECQFHIQASITLATQIWVVSTQGKQRLFNLNLLFVQTYDAIHANPQTVTSIHNLICTYVYFISTEYITLTNRHFTPAYSLGNNQATVYTVNGTRTVYICPV